MNVFLLFILCIPTDIISINIQIDGVIDLGPKWDYEYRISRISNAITTNTGDTSSKKPHHFTLPLRGNQKASKISSKKRKKRVKNKRKRHKNNKNNVKNNNINTIISNIQKNTNLSKSQIFNNGIKKNINNLKQSNQISHDHRLFNNSNFHQMYDEKKSVRIMSTEDSNALRRVTEIDLPTYNHNNIFVKEHRLEEKEIPYKFVLHVYKQFLRFFDNIKGKLNDSKLDQDLKKLEKSYKDQFEPFLNKTVRHVKIKTKLGTQKLISNIMATSNIILNHIFSKLPQVKADIIKEELNRRNEMEDQHACYTLGICQKSSVFGDFLVDILTILLQGNDFRVQQGVNAWTESLKNTDLTNIFYSPIRDKIQKTITKIELQPVGINRPILSILRSALARRDMPVYIMGENDKYFVNVTITFRELIQIVDESCTKYNPSIKWGELKKKVEEWIDGKRKDILSIIDKIIKNIKYALEKMSFQERTKLNEVVKALFKSLFKMEFINHDTSFTRI